MGVESRKHSGKKSQTDLTPSQDRSYFYGQAQVSGSTPFSEIVMRAIDLLLATSPLFLGEKGRQGTSAVSQTLHQSNHAKVKLSCLTC